MEEKNAQAMLCFLMPQDRYNALHKQFDSGDDIILANTAGGVTPMVRDKDRNIKTLDGKLIYPLVVNDFMSRTPVNRLEANLQAKIKENNGKPPETIFDRDEQTGHVVGALGTDISKLNKTPKVSDSLCRKCKKPAIKKCSGCKCATYCDSDCQTTDWLDHKSECKSLRIARHVIDESSKIDK